ncbi:MAG TPA: DedA family protein [Candidatus Acidoferrales bacterium]|nr:DedA family protein [Candidatus Acidoferrales bacterium]
MQHLTQFFISLVAHAGYPGLFFVMILGNIGIPVGTELVVPMSGALSGPGQPLPNLWLSGTVATLGEVAGAGIFYAVGFAGGRPFVERYGKYIGLSLHKLDIAHSFYERHGRKTVFFCRLIPVIRGVSSLPAGISRMQKRYFFTYTAAGSGIFCFGLVLLGSVFGRHIGRLAPYLHKLSLLILATVVVVAVYVVLRMSRKRRREAL